MAGLISAAGPVGFAVAAVAAQSLQVGYDPAVEDLSALAAQDAQHPWVMAAGILLLGTSVLALAVGLRLRLVRGEAAQVGGVILALGLGGVLAALLAQLRGFSISAMGVSLSVLLFGVFALLEQEAVKSVAGPTWVYGALLAAWGAYELRPANTTR